MTAPTTEKLQGYEFYRRVLGSPRYIVAPMVDHSELAWRVLSRRHGAQLCYTPMLHARLFAESAAYRAAQFSCNAAEDAPLVVQFCANDAATLLAAARLVEARCAAVDLNLGCPQGIVKKGHYGAFLTDDKDWDCVCAMVNTLHVHLAVPVTCKIRIFSDVNKTIAFAKRLQAAGCQLLTVHGRTRDMKGHKTGLADWEQIRRVKEVLDIPVFANGNICYFEDVQRCLDFTKCDGVMTAEGNLYNPALFTGIFHPVWKLAIEYLEICKEIPNSADVGMMRAHLFKIFAPCLNDHPDLRTELAAKHTFDDFWRITHEFKKRILESTNNATEYVPPAEYELDSRGLRILPNWVCQPHFRPELPSTDANQPLKKSEEEGQQQDEQLQQQQQVPEKELDELSAERLKRKTEKRAAKLEKVQEYITSKKARKATGKNPVCTSKTCLNLGSSKCVFEYCKPCCRNHVKMEKITDLDKVEGNEKYVCDAHHTVPSV